MTQSNIGANQILAWEQSKERQTSYEVRYANGDTGVINKEIFDHLYSIDSSRASKQRDAMRKYAAFTAMHVTVF